MLHELTQEERTLALDVSQAMLDIVGIVDPSPTADGVNTLISLARGNWLDAGISGISMLPFLGDLAKSGRLPKHLQTIETAIARARFCPRLDGILRETLTKLDDALSLVPVAALPAALAQPVRRLREMLSGYLGRAARIGSRNQQLTDEILFLRFGRVQDASGNLRRNVTRLVDFLIQRGVADRAIHSAAAGIDLHRPVLVRTLRKGERYVQYVDAPKAAGKLGEVGQWFARSGQSADSLGILKGNRARETFEVTQDVEVLESTAAAVVDFWTPRDFHLAQNRFTHRVTDRVVERSDTGQLVVRSGARSSVPGLKSSVGIGARGGGQQFLLPGKGAWERFMTRISRP